MLLWNFGIFDIIIDITSNNFTSTRSAFLLPVFQLVRNPQHELQNLIISNFVKRRALIGFNL